MPRMSPGRTTGVYELLRESVAITDVLDGEIGDKVDCVFHDEVDTPDMHIYEDHAHCFACNEHGDVTKVWMHMHGFQTMWEAAQDLARKVKVELPEISPEAQQRYEERRTKEEGHAKVAAERHKALKDPDNPRGRAVQEYITGRGITDEIRDRFQLGATPEGHLNIPFWSGAQVHGQVIRRLDGREPKYRAPKAEDFPLGRRPLLRVGRAKPQGYLIVEGYLDQPAAEVLGIPAIGTGGARLSKEQILDLREMGAKGATFYILPDDEKGGEDAARRNTARLYPHAFKTAPIPMEGVKDVSDLYNHDPENAAQVLRDLMDEGKDALELAMDELPTRPLEKVRHLKREIVPLILQLDSQAEREAVVKAVAAAPGLNTKIVTDALLEQEAVRVVTNDPAEDAEEIPRSEWGHLLAPGVLARYRDAVCRRQGVVGEVDRLVVEIVALCMVGAQLAPLATGRPLGSSMALLGPSGRGKNYLCDAAVAFAPDEWYKAFTVASGQAFYWAAKRDPAFLKHVFVYPNEIEAIDTVIEFLRPMLSQGHAEKYVTNKNDSGAFTFEALQVEGPMTGVLPTVRNKLDGQLQTRLLMTELTDYEGRIREQTRAFSKQLSTNRPAEVSDETRKLWQAALRSLAKRRQVVWFCAENPAFSLDNDDLEHGARLWANLIGLGSAHAFLEQENREITVLDGGTEAIVANAEDYRLAYELVKATSKRSMENLSDVHRKILDAIHELQSESVHGGHSLRKIANKAGVSKSTVHRNKTFLDKSQVLIEEDWQDHGLRLRLGVEPSWWEEGEPMRGFPTPETVASWDARAADGGTPRNGGTPEQKPDSYAEKPVPEARNGSGTRSASETNGHRAGEALFEDVEVF